MSFIKITEQNSLYNDLERKSVRDLLEDINTEDQKVALAVRETIPKIEELVLQIVPRMKQGGRIFYLGAGTSGRLGVLDASEIPDVRDAFHTDCRLDSWWRYCPPESCGECRRR